MPPEITETTITAENTEQSAALEAEAKAKAKAEAKAEAEKAKAEEAAKAAALAEQETAAKLQAEADEKAAADKLQADAEEASRKAEEEKLLDMSLDARMARAKDALAEAIDAQNQINRIVDEKTKALDELIIEKAGTPDNNPMTEIQFYLTSQQRKREQKAEQRNRELEQGIDAAELIRKLDGRAPVDQRPPAKRKNPATLKAVKPAVAA